MKFPLLKQKELLLRIAVEMLQYLHKQGEVQYTDFDPSICLPTFNTRLRKLLKLNLVEHCMAKQPKRREWYEITERGKNVLKIIESMIRLPGK